MPPKLYELRVFKGDRQVRTANRLAVVLDFSDPERVNDQLRRHVHAVAERDGAQRRDAHLYHVDVHETRDGRAENRALHTYALPVEA